MKPTNEQSKQTLNIGSKQTLNFKSTQTLNNRRAYPETSVSLTQIPQDSPDMIAALVWNSLAPLTMHDLSKCPDSIAIAIAQTRKHCYGILSNSKYL